MSGDILDWLPSPLLDSITVEEVNEVTVRLEQLHAAGIVVEEYKLVQFAEAIARKFPAGIWRANAIKRLARLGRNGRQALQDARDRHARN